VSNNTRRIIHSALKAEESLVRFYFCFYLSRMTLKLAETSLAKS